MKLSVVIPVYNGSKTIGRLVEELKQSLDKYSLQIILVNDYSTDDSYEVCKSLSTEQQEVDFISLRKNGGEHNAVMCGLNYAEGEYIAILDDDFQNPPSEVEKLLQSAIDGNLDVVYSKYTVKKHHWFRNLGSKINDFVSTILLDKPKKLYLSSFKVLTGEIVKEIVKYRGPFPYIDGLIFRCTSRVGSCAVEHAEREEGESNYTLSKLLSLYFNMFFNFSVKPLRICTYTGTALFIIGVIISIVFSIQKMNDPSIQLGWTSIFVVIVTLSGIQLIFLGVMSEYLGKLYLDVNGTPQYTIHYSSLRSNDKQD